MSFNLKNCARITFKHIPLGHFSISTWILNYCSRETGLENTNISSLIRTRQIVCKISFKKVSFLNNFFEDKGQFAQMTGISCVRDVFDRDASEPPRATYSFAGLEVREELNRTLSSCSCATATEFQVHTHRLVIENRATESNSLPTKRSIMNTRQRRTIV